MSICALPTLVEKNVAEYLTAHYNGGYSINRGFSASDLVLPALIIKAGKFEEMEPGTSVFIGDLDLAVITQIDEATDALQAHDEAVTTIYALLQGGALLAAFNAQESGQLWGVYIDSYDQERVERSFVSTITLKIHVQTLAL